MISEQIDDLLKKKKELEAQAGITMATTTEETNGLAEDLARDFAPDFVFTIIDHLQSSCEAVAPRFYLFSAMILVAFINF